MGVLLAVFIVADKNFPNNGILPSDWFGGIGTLGDMFSFLFYLWFVAIFVMLSARALPNKGQLGSDCMYVLADGANRLRKAFTIPNINFPKTEDNED